MDPNAVILTTNASTSSTFHTTVVIMDICMAIVVLVAVIALWKVYQKAGRAGWEAIIPIYNWYVLNEISGNPGWWLIFYFIPVVNLVFTILVLSGLSRSFGKGTGFTIGLFFLAPIFLLILAFGKAQYMGTAQPIAPAPVNPPMPPTAPTTPTSGQ